MVQSVIRDWMHITVNAVMWYSDGYTTNTAFSAIWKTTGNLHRIAYFYSYRTKYKML